MKLATGNAKVVNDTHLRQRLRRRIDDLGLNLQEVSDTAGLHRTVLEKLLYQRQKQFKRSTIAKLAKALKVRPAWLADGEEPMQAPTSDRVHLTTPSSISADLKRTRELSFVLSRDSLYTTLENFYCHGGRELVKFNEHRFPAIVFEAHESQWENIEAARGELLSTDIPDISKYREKGKNSEHFDPAGELPFQELHQKGIIDPANYWNGPTFDMVSITETGRGHEMTFRIGRYFSALASTDRLIADEIIETLLRNRNASLKLEELKHRRLLHEQLGGKDPVCCGDFRSAAASVDTLVVFNDKHRRKDNDGEYSFFMYPRSGSVGTLNYLLHLIPSGMFQNSIVPDEPEEEFTVRGNFLREWFEELYNQQVVRNSDGRIAPTYFHDQPAMLRLIDRLQSADERRKAELYFTGISVDLLTLRPGLCTLLLIRDPNWISEEGGPSPGGQSIQICKEYISGQPPAQLNSLLSELRVTKHKGIVKLNRKLEIAEAHDLGPHNMIPQAGSILNLGLKVAKCKLGIVNC